MKDFNYLEKIPYSYEFVNDNHIKIDVDGNILNFYPSTGTFNYNGSGRIGRGVKELYAHLGISDDPNIKISYPENIGLPQTQQRSPISKVKPPMKSLLRPDIKLKYKKLRPDAISPVKKRLTDAGIDLFAVEETDWVQYGNMWYAIVKTGIAMEIPIGYYFATAPRSSALFDNKISTYHSVLDTGYLGEFTFLVHTFSSEKPPKIKRGVRLSQIILVPIPLVDTDLEEVEELPVYGDRCYQGFGSSGDTVSRIIENFENESETPPFDV